jgi:hypothetical protein
LVLTLLAFIRARSEVSVEELIEYGQRDVLFERLFDLYDVGLLKRTGARVSLTDAALSVLERAEL